METSLLWIGLRNVLREGGMQTQRVERLEDMRPPLPDVLILEPPDEGWDPALAVLTESGLSTLRVLAVCPVNGAREAAEMLALGIAGCVAPNEHPRAVLDRVRAVARGDWRSTRRELFRLLDEEYRDAPLLHALGPRDRDVLGLIAAGMSNAHIAEELNRSMGTVRNRVSAVYRKIGVGTRAEAVRWAWQHGLGRAGEGGF